jgi:hypothetical protein
VAFPGSAWRDITATEIRRFKKKNLINFSVFIVLENLGIKKISFHLAIAIKKIQ